MNFMGQPDRHRAFQPLRLRLSSITDAEARQKLELHYENMQFRRAEAVTTARDSAIADRRRQIAQAEAEIAFIELMKEAGEYLDEIKREAVWAAYRKAGEIIFECPFSESDMRNALSVERAALEQRAQSLEDGGHFYEPGDEGQEEQ